MARKKASRKARQRRARAITLGIAWLLVLFIIGTFAYLILETFVFNVDLVDAFPGGRIHDVSQERGEFDMHGERNKNVFAENFGEIPIGVRIQFREFVRIAGIEFENSELNEDMLLHDISTWGIFEANALMENGNLIRRNYPYPTTASRIGDLAISWEIGQASDEVKIFMPTFNHANRRLTELQLDLSLTVPVTSVFFSQYVFQFSDASGRAIDAIAAGLDWDGVDHVTEFNELGTRTGYENHTGLQDFWYNGQIHESYLYYIDDDTGFLVRSAEPVEHTARPTLTPSIEINPAEFDFNPLTFRGVITLTRWLELGRPSGNFWIMDTENPGGWFYWNGWLEPGQATSLLLNSTNLPLIRRLEYIIRINSDFFTLGSLPDDISDAARQIFE